MIFYIILGLIALLIIYGIAVYNRLIKLKNRVENAWSQIDVQLQRRHDLIPNLIETVKGYMKHERETLESVTKARTALMSAQGVAEKAMADNMLTNALKTLFAVAESYPDLKASQNFLELQVELKGTEDKIAFSRQFYNDSVQRFNTEIQLFPNNIIANMLGFKEKEYFEVKDEETRKNVHVQF